MKKIFLITSFMSILYSILLSISIILLFLVGEIKFADYLDCMISRLYSFRNNFPLECDFHNSWGWNAAYQRFYRGLIDRGSQPIYFSRYKITNLEDSVTFTDELVIIFRRKIRRKIVVINSNYLHI